MLKYLIPALLLITVSLQAEDIDTGLAKLSTDLSAAITKSGSKKISVIDFTDLEGRESQLGRYMAEQLSVSLVNSAKDFVVMDRANLASILKEHKLTASGLVNPENARELGQFAGVDAIVLGSITPFGEKLAVTAKAISTETTQVLGATRTTIARSKDIDAMLELGKPSSSIADFGTGSEATTNALAPDYVAPNGTNVFDDLAVEIVSFKRTTNNEILVLLSLKNLSKSTIRVGINEMMIRDGPDRKSAYLVDEQGNVFYFHSAQGIGSPRRRGYNSTTSTFEDMRFELIGYKDAPQNGWRDSLNIDLNQMVEIGIGHSIVATIGFPTTGVNSVGTTFRLQIDLIVAQISNRDIALSLDNVMIPGIQPK